MDAGMILHPIKPALDGKVFSRFKAPSGKKLFIEFVRVCREHGEGTVDYLWLKPGHEQPVPKLSYVKLFHPWGWIVGTGMYLADVEQAVSEKEHEITSAIKGQRNHLSSILLLLLVLTDAGITYISKRITLSIARASAMLKNIAWGKGDLTARMSAESRDDIGEMAHWFNVFIEKIQTIITDVQKNVEQLNGSPTTLSSIAQQTSAGAHQTSNKASTEAQASEKVSENMNSVAAAMEQAATNLSMVATAAEEMTATIQEIAKNTEKANMITGER